MKLTQDALSQMRQTRSLIDPDLLERARQVIAERASRQGIQMNKPDTSGKIPVDQVKNLAIIKKLIELKSDDNSFQKRLLAFFAD